MPAKTSITEEVYCWFAWTNFWYRKTGLLPLNIGEVALLAVDLSILRMLLVSTWLSTSLNKMNSLSLKLRILKQT